MPVILRVDKVPQVLAEALAHEHTVYEYSKLSAKALSDIAGEIQVILASGESTVTASLINQLPELKLIAVFGVGYDGVDIHAAFERNVQVTNTPDILTDDVADLGIALMLNVSRKINGAQKFIERGNWLSGSYPPSTKVSGGRLGIVGFGRIGRAVASRAKGFAMSIACFDKNPVDSHEVAYYDNLLELAKNSDVLMVCASAGKESHKLINHDVLSALGAKGILINIARGSVVDEEALVEAITQGTIGGAGLDVFANEPHIPQALLDRDEVVVTPHIGSATQATRAAMAKLVMDNIAAFYASQALLTPVTSPD
ncbi:2-hydroxyacid dehydrogenase [Citrobacter amalonaticus]|uniref:2-hydroxyacid dehydrogenase n=1 Tax=Citrobacter amalonaticus TaxID=35703 RepID=A0A2S4RS22_CITAM|nr:2-hydroxyacid dehydrogenase [Citrobacter amalonaticus]POT55700.1 2-hydroxyacid dehydrogenase [Citrobacter amalonaticus]POT73913.1 2-hydroxyacid dehydrogenase [Citrobacter amalonaticus]POU62314.1 2-hydroxyacid dehydrogenase [Citrobacter amalonaticus]POV02816.1 2-hydroxyacid dehydrogenase [Citrobacter amalonaticus]